MRKREYDRQLLQKILKDKDKWMLRTLILRRRLELLGYRCSDVLLAEKGELHDLIEKEIFLEQWNREQLYENEKIGG